MRAQTPRPGTQLAGSVKRWPVCPAHISISAHAARGHCQCPEALCSNSVEQTGRAETAPVGTFERPKHSALATRRNATVRAMSASQSKSTSAVVANVAFVVARRSASKSSLWDSFLLLPVPHLGW